MVSHAALGTVLRGSAESQEVNGACVGRWFGSDPCFGGCSRTWSTALTVRVAAVPVCVNASIMKEMSLFYVDGTTRDRKEHVALPAAAYFNPLPGTEIRKC